MPTTNFRCPALLFMHVNACLPVNYAAGVSLNLGMHA